MIQCSRIYYRLGGIIATEHYEQIADHSSLLVVIKLYHILIAQLLQCHLPEPLRPGQCGIRSEEPQGGQGRDQEADR